MHLNGNIYKILEIGIGAGELHGEKIAKYSALNSKVNYYRKVDDFQDFIQVEGYKK
jgi:hypothetical protein